MAPRTLSAHRRQRAPMPESANLTPDSQSQNRANQRPIIGEHSESQQCRIVPSPTGEGTMDEIKFIPAPARRAARHAPVGASPVGDTPLAQVSVRDWGL